MLEAIQEHWLGSFLLNVLGYALILVPAALLIRHWKKSPRVQRGQCITHEMSAFANVFLENTSASHPIFSQLTTTGEGVVYSLLHQLVFGDDRSEDALGVVEEGKASSVPKTRETAAEMTGSEYWGKLVVCVVGLQASYLTWGVVQVTHLYFFILGVLLSTPYGNLVDN